MLDSNVAKDSGMSIYGMNALICKLIAVMWLLLYDDGLEATTSRSRDNQGTFSTGWCYRCHNDASIFRARIKVQKAIAPTEGRASPVMSFSLITHTICHAVVCIELFLSRVIES